MSASKLEVLNLPFLDERVFPLLLKSGVLCICFRLESTSTLSAWSFKLELIGHTRPYLVHTEISLV